MTKKTYVVLLTIIPTVCCFSSKKADVNKKAIKPNIIYILADDLGYGDIRGLNPDSKIPTPNIDRMVEEGVHFTDAHSNSSVSTPTRYGILTGRYAFRSNLKKGVLDGYSPALLESGRTTIATFLSEYGYNTACIGKWHLGLDWAQNNYLNETASNSKLLPIDVNKIDYSRKVKGGPNNHGFKYSYIIPASLDMPPYCYINNGMVVNPPTEFTGGKDQNVNGRGVYWRPGKMSPGFDFQKVLQNTVDTACNYIKKYAHQEPPIFMYLALPSPHTPWCPEEKYEGKSEAGKYGDFVFMTDDMIGKILKTIKEENIEENTIIIVTSDNGSDWRPSDKEEWNHSANYIYKGRKADIFEAGHRVPFIAQWKGVIPAGQKSNEIMCTTDLIGTVSGMLNVEMPENGAEDSYNLWPAFVGNSQKGIREAIIHHSFDGFFSIRKGKWKFTPHIGSGGFTIPKNIPSPKNKSVGTLYDLEKDPEEKNNLFEEYPMIVEELRVLLDKYQKQGYSRTMNGNSTAKSTDLSKLLRPVPNTGIFINDSLYIWGGSLVKSLEDGMYHMYYSRWPKELKMEGWVTHSEIAHAVSNSPYGPFEFKDIAIGARDKELWDGLVAHNPTIHYFNGKYYLYYMGTTGDSYSEREYWKFRNNQKIGVAVSESPFGPWVRQNKPLIDISANPDAHDALMVSNPAVTLMPDGKYLMVYKAAAKKGKAPMFGPVVHLTAVAESPEGPFIKQNQPIFTAEKNEFPAEDPYIWYDDSLKYYYAIVKDMNGAFTDVGKSLVLFISKDGFNWELAEHPLVSKLKVVMENGEILQLDKLERPQIYIENGQLVALLCAARINAKHSFNIQIPLRQYK